MKMHGPSYQKTHTKVEHLIHECGKLNNERRKPIVDISKEDQWPVRKSVLVNKYLKQITHFTNSIDYENMCKHSEINQME
jgi:hypothetical protein